MVCGSLIWRGSVPNACQSMPMHRSPLVNFRDKCVCGVHPSPASTSNSWSLTPTLGVGSILQPFWRCRAAEGTGPDKI